MAEEKCFCGEIATQKCVKCKINICDNNDCGSDTVDGYLCGTYTQWGCGRKYTTCDECLDDKAVHEGDLVMCDSCGEGMCDECAKEKFVDCAECEVPLCDECMEQNTCEECDITLCSGCVDSHECE